MKEESKSRKPLIQSLDRALDILEFIGTENGSVRSIDIAEKIGIKSNTANNLLRVLYQRGYLSQDFGRGYVLGSKCWELGVKADRWSLLREVTVPIMKELSSTTGDLTFLGALDKFNLICVESIAGSGVVTIADQHAWRERTHCSASGKILLGVLSDSELEIYFSKIKLESFTNETVTLEMELKKQLKEIKKRGFAICKDEAGEGVSAIGVAIYGKNQQIIAALAQSFPTYFLESGKINIEERVTLLKKAAKLINQEYNRII